MWDASGVTIISAQKSVHLFFEKVASVERDEGKKGRNNVPERK